MEFFRFTRGERLASLALLLLTAVVLMVAHRQRQVVPVPPEEARRFDSLVRLLEVKKEKTGDTVMPAQKKRVPRHFGKYPVTKRRRTQSLSRPDILPGREDHPSLPEKKRPFLIELNRADTLALDTLPGIPHWMAVRIIRYRDLLGGYVRKEQLLEVYGLDSVCYQTLCKRTCIDTLRIRQIDLNACDLRTLMRHPYLSRRQGEAILFLREHFGRVGSVEELLHQRVLPPESFRRVAPYLTVTKENK